MIMHTENTTNTSFKLVMSAILLNALIFCNPVRASDEQPQTITVYVDIGFVGKKTRGAKALNKSHMEQQKLGYRFVDLELYVENGDLQGMFVTYIKD